MYIKHVQNVYAQADAAKVRASGTCVQVPDQPRVVIFSYIAFVHPAQRFGLFAGEPFGDRQGNTDAFPSLTGGMCVGTYGGLVCDAEEALDRDGLYTYHEPELPPRPKGGT